MSDMLLDLITKQQARVGQAIDLRTGTAIQSASQAEQALRTIEQSVATAGQSQELVLRTQRLGQMQAQQVANDALAAAGGAPLLNALITRTVQKGEEVSQSLADLRKAKNTSFFGDGPIEWIKAQLTLPKIEENVKDSAIELNTLQQRAVGVNNMIQEVGQTAAATARTITQASISAEIDALAAEWAIKGQQAYLERLKNNLVGPTAIMQAEDAKLDALYNAAQFNRQEKEYQLSVRREARQAQQDAWMQEERTIVRAERAAQKQFDQKSMYFVNLARQARGELPMDESQFKDWRSFTPKEEQAELVNLGMQSEQRGMPMIAYSPAGVAKALLKNPEMNLDEVRNKSLGLIREALGELSAIKGSTDPKIAAKYDALRKDKTGAAAEAFVNEYVQGKLASLTTNVDSPTNILNIGSLSSFIGTPSSPGVSAIVNTPLVANVLGPAVQTGVTLDSPDAAFKLMTAGIQGDKISSGQAINDFVKIYRRAVALHRESLGLKTMGISMPENSQGYKVTLNGKLVDVTNLAEVSAAVASKLYADNMMRIRKEGAIPGFKLETGLPRYKAIEDARAAKNQGGL